MPVPSDDSVIKYLAILLRDKASAAEIESVIKELGPDQKSKLPALFNTAIYMGNGAETLDVLIKHGANLNSSSRYNLSDEGDVLTKVDFGEGRNSLNLLVDIYESKFNENRNDNLGKIGHAKKLDEGEKLLAQQYVQEIEYLLSKDIHIDWRGTNSAFSDLLSRFEDTDEATKIKGLDELNAYKRVAHTLLASGGYDFTAWRELAVASIEASSLFAFDSGVVNGDEILSKLVGDKNFTPQQLTAILYVLSDPTILLKGANSRKDATSTTNSIINYINGMEGGDPWVKLFNSIKQRDLLPDINQTADFDIGGSNSTLELSTAGGGTETDNTNDDNSAPDSQKEGVPDFAKVLASLMYDHKDIEIIAPIIQTAYEAELDRVGPSEKNHLFSKTFEGLKSLNNDETTDFGIAREVFKELFHDLDSGNLSEDLQRSLNKSLTFSDIVNDLNKRARSELNDSLYEADQSKGRFYFDDLLTQSFDLLSSETKEKIINGEISPDQILKSMDFILTFESENEGGEEADGKNSKNLTISTEKIHNIESISPFTFELAYMMAVNMRYELLNIVGKIGPEEFDKLNSSTLALYRLHEQYEKSIGNSTSYNESSQINNFALEAANQNNSSWLMVLLPMLSVDQLSELHSKTKDDPLIKDATKKFISSVATMREAGKDISTRSSNASFSKTLQKLGLSEDLATKIGEDFDAQFKSFNESNPGYYGRNHEAFTRFISGVYKGQSTLMAADEIKDGFKNYFENLSEQYPEGARSDEMKDFFSRVESTYFEHKASEFTNLLLDTELSPRKERGININSVLYLEYNKAFQNLSADSNKALLKGYVSYEDLANDLVTLLTAENSGELMAANFNKEFSDVALEMAYRISQSDHATPTAESDTELASQLKKIKNNLANLVNELVMVEKIPPEWDRENNLFNSFDDDMENGGEDPTPPPVDPRDIPGGGPSRMTPGGGGDLTGEGIGAGNGGSGGGNGGEGQDGEEKTFLIVEDEIFSVELKESLEERGYNVIVKKRLDAEALALMGFNEDLSLNADGAKVSGVFLDFHYAGLFEARRAKQYQGDDFLKDIVDKYKSNETLAKILPIVIMTDSHESIFDGISEIKKSLSSPLNPVGGSLNLFKGEDGWIAEVMGLMDYAISDRVRVKSFIFDLKLDDSKKSQAVYSAFSDLSVNELNVLLSLNSQDQKELSNLIKYTLGDIGDIPVGDFGSKFDQMEGSNLWYFLGDIVAEMKLLPEYAEVDLEARMSVALAKNVPYDLITRAEYISTYREEAPNPVRDIVFDVRDENVSDKEALYNAIRKLSFEDINSLTVVLPKLLNGESVTLDEASANALRELSKTPQSEDFGEAARQKLNDVVKAYDVGLSVKNTAGELVEILEKKLGFDQISEALLGSVRGDRIDPKNLRGSLENLSPQQLEIVKKIVNGSGDFVDADVDNQVSEVLTSIHDMSSNMLSRFGAIRNVWILQNGVGEEITVELNPDIIKQGFDSWIKNSFNPLESMIGKISQAIGVDSSVRVEVQERIELADEFFYDNSESINEVFSKHEGRYSDLQESFNAVLREKIESGEIKDLKQIENFMKGFNAMMLSVETALSQGGAQSTLRAAPWSATILGSGTYVDVLNDILQNAVGEQGLDKYEDIARYTNTVIKNSSPLNYVDSRHEGPENDKFRALLREPHVTDGTTSPLAFTNSISLSYMEIDILNPISLQEAENILIDHLKVVYGDNHVFSKAETAAFKVMMTGEGSREINLSPEELENLEKFSKNLTEYMSNFTAPDPEIQDALSKVSKQSNKAIANFKVNQADKESNGNGKKSDQDDIVQNSMFSSIESLEDGVRQVFNWTQSQTQNFDLNAATERIKSHSTRFYNLTSGIEVEGGANAGLALYGLYSIIMERERYMRLEGGEEVMSTIIAAELSAMGSDFLEILNEADVTKSKYLSSLKSKIPPAILSKAGQAGAYAGHFTIVLNAVLGAMEDEKYETNYFTGQKITEELAGLAGGMALPYVVGTAMEAVGASAPAHPLVKIGLGFTGAMLATGPANQVYGEAYLLVTGEVDRSSPERLFNESDLMHELRIDYLFKTFGTKINEDGDRVATVPVPKESELDIRIIKAPPGVLTTDQGFEEFVYYDGLTHKQKLKAVENLYNQEILGPGMLEGNYYEHVILKAMALELGAAIEDVRAKDVMDYYNKNLIAGIIMDQEGVYANESYKINSVEINNPALDEYTEKLFPQLSGAVKDDQYVSVVNGEFKFSVNQPIKDLSDNIVLNQIPPIWGNTPVTNGEAGEYLVPTKDLVNQMVQQQMLLQATYPSNTIVVKTAVQEMGDKSELPTMAELAGADNFVFVDKDTNVYYLATISVEELDFDGKPVSKKIATPSYFSEFGNSRENPNDWVMALENIPVGDDGRKQIFRADGEQVLTNNFYTADETVITSVYNKMKSDSYNLAYEAEILRKEQLLGEGNFANDGEYQTAKNSYINDARNEALRMSDNDWDIQTRDPIVKVDGVVHNHQPDITKQRTVNYARSSAGTINSIAIKHASNINGSDDFVFWVFEPNSLKEISNEAALVEFDALKANKFELGDRVSGVGAGGSIQDVIRSGEISHENWKRYNPQPAASSRDNVGEIVPNVAIGKGEWFEGDELNKKVSPEQQQQMQKFLEGLEDPSPENTGDDKIDPKSSSSININPLFPEQKLGVELKMALESNDTESVKIAYERMQQFEGLLVERMEMFEALAAKSTIAVDSKAIFLELNKDTSDASDPIEALEIQKLLLLNRLENLEEAHYNYALTNDRLFIVPDEKYDKFFASSTLALQNLADNPEDYTAREKVGAALSEFFNYSGNRAFDKEGALQNSNLLNLSSDNSNSMAGFASGATAMDNNSIMQRALAEYFDNSASRSFAKHSGGIEEDWKNIEEATHSYEILVKLAQQFYASEKIDEALLSQIIPKHTKEEVALAMSVEQVEVESIMASPAISALSKIDGGDKGDKLRLVIKESLADASPAHEDALKGLRELKLPNLEAYRKEAEKIAKTYSWLENMPAKLALVDEYSQSLQTSDSPKADYSLNIISRMDKREMKKFTSMLEKYYEIRGQFEDVLPEDVLDLSLPREARVGGKQNIIKNWLKGFEEILDGYEKSLNNQLYKLRGGYLLSSGEGAAASEGMPNSDGNVAITAGAVILGDVNTLIEEGNEPFNGDFVQEKRIKTGKS